MNQNPPPEQYPQPAQPRTVQVAVPNVKPYVTYSIIGFTIFIYLLQLAGQYLLPASLANSWIATFGTWATKISTTLDTSDIVAILGIKATDLIQHGQVWRLITPVFLHDAILPFGLLHIGFNMYALFLYGRGLEARFGHWRFSLLYFLSAYAGNVLSFLLMPKIYSLGASTAVFGLLAAEGIFVFQNRQLFGNRANRVLMNVLYVAGINLLIGFSSNGLVDNFGHLGGLLGGVLFTWFGGPRWKMEGFYPSMRVVDEREGHGALAGSVAVLLFFIPLTILGWIWIK